MQEERENFRKVRELIKGDIYKQAGIYSENEFGCDVFDRKLLISMFPINVNEEKPVDSIVIQ